MSRAKYVLDKFYQNAGTKYPIIGKTMESIRDADFVAAISNAWGIDTVYIMLQTKE